MSFLRDFWIDEVRRGLMKAPRTAVLPSLFSYAAHSEGVRQSQQRAAQRWFQGEVE